MSTESKPLIFRCPCGYRKRVPLSLKGKKVVCAKCKQKSRVAADKRRAQLLVQCPYCANTQTYSDSKIVCDRCQTPLTLGKSQRRLVVGDMDSDHNAVVVRVDDKHAAASLIADGPIAELDVETRPVGAAKVSRWSRIFGSQLLLTIINFGGCLLVLTFMWYLFGNALNMPKFPFDFGNQASGQQPSSVSANAFLTDPAVSILAVNFSNVVPPGDEVATGEQELKSVMNVQFENLTDCHLSRIDLAARLKISSGPDKKVRATKFVNIGPRATETASLELDAVDKVADVTLIVRRIESQNGQVTQTPVEATFAVDDGHWE